MEMGILLWVALGLAVGRIAQVVLKDHWHSATANNLILGVIGATVAGWLLSKTGFSGPQGLSIWVFVACLAGASATLWAGRAFTSTPILR